MGLDSIWHWLLLLAIVLLIFGAGKVTKIGPELGRAVRGFKEALNGTEERATPKAAASEPGAAVGTATKTAPDELRRTSESK